MDAHDGRDDCGEEVSRLRARVAALEARERDQSELLESEIKYRTLFEASADAIFVEGLDGRLLDCNQRAVALLGYSKEELLRMNVRDLVTPEVAVELAERMPELLRGAAYRSENIRQGGERVPVEVLAKPVEIRGTPVVIVIVRDLSEQKRAEEERLRMEAQLRHQQKLESIGTLASGVAHEINNPINIVMNYAELIARRTAGDEVVQQYAREIVGESERIATIVRNLLAFSRQEREGSSLARPFDLVASTLSLLHKLLEKDQIAVRVEVAEDLPRIRCRSQQMKQVLMNLLTNARDALNERYAGHAPDKVVVVTGQRVEDEGRKLVRLTVEDHGTGIPDDAIDRIFDPFFTRKPRELGTGLGLSVSHGIVAEHGGRILVETRLGELTRFHVDIPAVEE